MTGTVAKPLSQWVAADLMTDGPVTVRPETTIRDAVLGLYHAKVTGAPVVDNSGKLVGVFSLTDVVRWLASQAEPVAGVPRGCGYQDPLRGRGGTELVLCTLATGRCPFQRADETVAGQPATLCASPHEVSVDWQVVDFDALPADDVRHHMTADPMYVRRDAPIRELAQIMANGAVHRLIVVDDEFRPTGIVSSLDLVKALAVAPMAEAASVTA